jgi:hypothetical protein
VVVEPAANVVVVPAAVDAVGMAVEGDVEFAPSEVFEGSLASAGVVVTVIEGDSVEVIVPLSSSWPHAAATRAQLPTIINDAQSRLIVHLSISA